MTFVSIILIVLGIISIIIAILATPADRSYASGRRELGSRFFSFTFGFKLMTLFIMIGLILIAIGVLLLI